MKLNTLTEILFLGTDTDIESIEQIDKKIIVTFEIEKEKILNETGIKTIYFHRQAQNEKTWNEIGKTAKNWLNTWPNKTLNEGKSILEILKFEDTSLWWFVYDVLWESKNGIFDTIYQIETLISLLDKFNPQIVNIQGKFEFPIVKMLYSLQKKYSFEISDQSNFEVTILQNAGIISRKRVDFLLKLLILKFIHLFAKKKKASIAFFSIEGGVINKTEKGDKIAADKYFVGLEEFIEKNRKIINFICLNKNLGSEKFNKLCTNTLKGEYEPWVIYYSLKGIWNAYKKNKNFKKFLLEIENNSDFIESMTVKGINIFPFLREQIIGYLPLLIGFTHLELDAARQFLSKNDPQTVFSTDGFGVAGKALNYVCRKNGKRVLFPQLGIIPSEFMVNASFSISKGFDFRLLPEFLTWGKYFKELVEKRGYPQKLIKQVGFWITCTKNQIEKDEDYVFYIVGENQKKLKYILSVEEEIFTIRSIHNSLPRGIKLMVKLHPNHVEKPYLKTLGNLKNIILIGNNETVDVNDLVNRSKIVIGQSSTIIIQAIILDKPVITINFSGNVDFLGFKEIPFVTNIKDLTNIMNEIFQGKRQKKYKISDYCDPIGDKAVSNVINELMNS